MIRVLDMLASLRITAAALAVLAVAVLMERRFGFDLAELDVAALLTLAANLAAAMTVRRRLRRSPALMVFHACVVGIVLLLAAAGVIHWNARLEIAEGASFDPVDLLAPDGSRITGRGAPPVERFVQLSVAVDYQPGLVRGASQAEVLVVDGARRVQMTVDDRHPLVLDGTRFSLTSNKGFAALVEWRTNVGVMLHGTVNFPSYPLYDWNQVQHWTAPDGSELTLELDGLAPVPLGRSWRFDRSRARNARIRVEREGARPVSLGAGDRHVLPGGVLRLIDVRPWVGYRVDREPLVGYLLGLALVGIAALGAHYRVSLCRDGALAKPRATVAADA